MPPNFERTLKGIRFLLLKRPENLDPDKGEPERIQKTIEMKGFVQFLLSERPFQISLGSAGSSAYRWYYE